MSLRPFPDPDPYPDARWPLLPASQAAVVLLGGALGERLAEQEGWPAAGVLGTILLAVAAIQLLGRLLLGTGRFPSTSRGLPHPPRSRPPLLGEGGVLGPTGLFPLAVLAGVVTGEASVATLSPDPWIRYGGYVEVWSYEVACAGVGVGLALLVAGRTDGRWRPVLAVSVGYALGAALAVLVSLPAANDFLVTCAGWVLFMLAVGWAVRRLVRRRRGVASRDES
jgi:hypothetical protein